MTYSMLAFTSFQLIMAMAIFAICLLLILIILVQKGRGGGLASAFGGGGGGGGAFGAKTGDVFTGITVVLAGVYLLLTVFGNFVFRPATAPPPIANIQNASGTNPAPTSAGGAPTGATSPQSLPPGAIKINAESGKTSIGGAIEKSEQALKDAAEKTSEALGEAADETGEAIDNATGAAEDAVDEATDENETP